MKGLIIFFVLLTAAACTKNATYHSARWSGDGDAPLAPAGVDSKATKLTVGDGQRLDFQYQTITGVLVEDAFYKKLDSAQGPSFISYNWITEIPFSIKADLLAMRAERPFLLSQFFKLYPSYQSLSLEKSPELVIRTMGTQKVLWKMLFVKQDGILIATYVDRRMRIMDQKIIGSQFVDGTGALFPDGPLKSDVQQVVLRNLLGNKTLTSDRVRISTQANALATADDNQFLYPPEDVRFQQVQTFFYLSNSLSWFRANMNFDLPFMLEAETSFGFPRKETAAFYNNHKIRLGEGDGESYDKMTLDPSIVTHESVHAIVDAIAGLPSGDDGGSINEAFADYFAAVQLGNPRMGEASYKLGPYKRTIDNTSLFSDRNGGLYHDSLVFSGLLWQMHSEIGEDIANKMAWSILLRLNPKTDFNSLVVEIKDVVSKQDEAVQAKANAILKQRGWL